MEGELGEGTAFVLTCWMESGHECSIALRAPNDTDTSSIRL